MLKKYSDKIIFIIMIFLIFSIICINFNNINIPYILNDEYGYWASAAYFVGYDWSKIVSTFTYYSYGYGLILAPLFLLCKNSLIVYKMAILLNGIYLSLSLFLLYKISDRFFYAFNKKLRLLVCFIIVLYSANVTQIYYTWPETFLFFLFCFITYVIIKLYEKPTILKSIVLAFLVVYNYTIHQRTIGILISTVIVIGFLQYCGKIKWRHTISFFSILFLSFFAHGIVKNDIIEQVWLGSSVIENNDYSGQVGKLQYFMQEEGVFAFFTSLSGKLFNMFVASFGLMAYSIEFLSSNFIASIKNSFKIKSFKGVDYISLFLLLAFFSSLMISTLFMIHPGTTTHLIYGRYTDNILGPYLLFAILGLDKFKFTKRKLILYLGIFITIAISVKSAILFFQVYYRDTTVNNAGISIYFNGTKLYAFFAVILTISIFGLILFLWNVKDRNDRYRIIACLMCMIFWIKIGLYSFEVFNSGDWCEINPSIIKCAEFIQEKEEQDNIEYIIYGLQGDDWVNRNYATALQYMLPTHDIEYILSEDISEIENSINCVIITHEDMVVSDKLNFIGNYGIYNLYTIADE